MQDVNHVLYWLLLFREHHEAFCQFICHCRVSLVQVQSPNEFYESTRAGGMWCMLPQCVSTSIQPCVSINLTAYHSGSGRSPAQMSTCRSVCGAQDSYLLPGEVIHTSLSLLSRRQAVKTAGTERCNAESTAVSSVIVNRQCLPEGRASFLSAHGLLMAYVVGEMPHTGVGSGVTWGTILVVM